MRSRYRVHDSTLAHFVTGTIVEWLPVFTSAALCDILVESLRYCREHKGLRISAWVILDNHFHAILTAPDLSRVVMDFKKFTARQIIETLRAERREWLLNQLSYYCAAHKQASEHQVWQEGSHPQAIRSDTMMMQSRAERDRLRAEPQPERCRRRAASTAITCISIPCVAVW